MHRRNYTYVSSSVVVQQLWYQSRIPMWTVEKGFGECLCRWIVVARIDQGMAERSENNDLKSAMFPSVEVQELVIAISLVVVRRIPLLPQSMLTIYCVANPPAHSTVARPIRYRWCREDRRT
jgi:hypothetical protein